jgi:hypothetical protein
VFFRTIFKKITSKQIKKGRNSKYHVKRKTSLIVYDKKVNYLRLPILNYFSFIISGRNNRYKCHGVRSTERQAIYFQFDIRANARHMRAVQSPKCIV